MQGRETLKFQFTMSASTKPVAASVQPSWIQWDRAEPELRKEGIHGQEGVRASFAQQLLER
jgi:hypothetical protein